MTRLGTEQASENDDGIADADEVFHSNADSAPQMNATLYGSAPNRLRIVGSVYADAGFVQAHPNHPYEIVRAGREIVIIFRADAVVQHAFVVSEPWPGGGALNFPCSNRRRQCGRAGRDRENANKFIVLENFEQPLCGINVDFAGSEFGFRRNFLLSDFFNFEWHDVGHFELVARLELRPVHSGI